MSVLLCIILFTVSCNRKNKVFVLTDQDYILIKQQIVSAHQSKSSITFNSVGGKVSVALKISQLLDEFPSKIIVSNLCFSNCAEIILPSAQSVEFSNSPMIGFHGNFSSYRSYIEASNLPDSRYCNWKYEDEFQNLLSTKNLRSDFWMEQTARLKPKVEFELRPKECPWRHYNFENHMWLPTSQQLRELWGLKFSGSVCADDFEACTNRVNQSWDKGTRIVIGNRVYISKGQ